MIEKKISKIISPSLNKMGFQIFRIKLEKNSKSNSILQIMIEYNNGKPININDCSKISKHVSVLLDVEEVIDFSYNLEISSPGINRPLEAIGDFVKFIGKLISIELYDKSVNDDNLASTFDLVYCVIDRDGHQNFEPIQSK